MIDPIADSPVGRNMAARIFAHDEIIETLLATLFAERGPAFEANFIALLHSRTWAQTPPLGDAAAEWWADVSVLSRGSRDLLIERAQQSAQHLRGQGSSASS